MNRGTATSRISRKRPKEFQKSFKFQRYYSHEYDQRYHFSSSWHPRNTRSSKQNQTRRRLPMEYKISHSEPKERDSWAPNDSDGETLRKIQETSDMIKRQLMRPDNPIDSWSPTRHDDTGSTLSNQSTNSQIKPTKSQSIKEKKKIISSDKRNEISQKSNCIYNVKEIHSQILDHIVKLNDGRKQNFINADTTGYDAAIQEIYKKKSLELSKALREMSHQEQPKSSDVVNSIIPDFAIKFEELPPDIIRELSSSFEAIDQNVNVFDEYPFSSATNQTSITFNSSDCYNQGELNNQEPPDKRVFLLNSEDSDSIVVKAENSFEGIVKSEPLDLIEIMTSDDSNHSVKQENGTDGKIQLPPSDVNEVRHIQEVSGVSTSETSKSINDDSSQKGSISPKETVIGSLRISSNLFEKTSSMDHTSVINNGDPKDSSNFAAINTNNAINSGEQFSIGVNTVNHHVPPVNPPQKENNTISETLVGCKTSSAPSENNIQCGSAIKQSNKSLREPSKKRNKNFRKKKRQVKNREYKYNKKLQLQYMAVSNRLQDEHSREVLRTNENAPSNTESIAVINEDNNLPNSSVIECSTTSQHILRNNSLSLTINSDEKPKTFNEAVKMMLDIDEGIEKLMNFRKGILLSLGKPEDDCLHDNNRCNSKKRKRNDLGHNRAPPNDNPATQTREESTNNELSEIVELDEARMMRTEDEVIDALEKLLAQQRNDFDLDIDCLGIPRICKIIDNNMLVIGTDCGKIQYFNMNKGRSPLTYSISENPISCIECIYWNKRPRRLLVGTASEKVLKVFKYKFNTEVKSIMLEDVIQAVHKQWQWVFIGGPSGYLTRFNFMAEKVQFEDRISEMSLKSLVTAKEGPRQILIVLFIDSDGESHIHIRDAISALHIRTISGNMQVIHFPTSRNSTLYTVFNQEISLYNSNDGQFVSKFEVPSNSSVLKMYSLENLLFAISLEGIVVYNMNNNSYIGSVECPNITAFKILKDKIIYGTSDKQLKTLKIPSFMLAVNQR